RPGGADVPSERVDEPPTRGGRVVAGETGSERYGQRPIDLPPLARIGVRVERDVERVRSHAHREEGRWIGTVAWAVAVAGFVPGEVVREVARKRHAWRRVQVVAVVHGAEVLARDVVEHLAEVLHVAPGGEGRVLAKGPLSDGLMGSHRALGIHHRKRCEPDARKQHEQRDAEAKGGREPAKIEALHGATMMPGRSRRRQRRGCIRSVKSAYGLMGNGALRISSPMDL